MPTCPSCHRFKKKSVYARHWKKCIPSKDDLNHYLRSKSGKHADDCDCKKCKKRKKRKVKKE